MPHFFSRILFTMNPDGTDQTEFYGSNSYWPNSLVLRPADPRPPTRSSCAIVSGHHGVAAHGRAGPLRPRHGPPRSRRRRAADPRPRASRSSRSSLDGLVGRVWPRFLHPYPLGDKYFLVSCQPGPTRRGGIYLVDVFDNLVLLARGARLRAARTACRSAAARRPPVIPDRVDPEPRATPSSTSTDVYAGPGPGRACRAARSRRCACSATTSPTAAWAARSTASASTARGTCKRILGTVPVEADGSAPSASPPTRRSPCSRSTPRARRCS